MRLLISAGPTREPIDPVRFLSNYSTGFMGLQLAREAIRRRHRVTMVCGPIEEPMPAQARVIRVERAQEMAEAMRKEAAKADAVIMAAAVADFQPVHFARLKLKRSGRLTLQLKATPDIIGRLPRQAGQVRAGFALEARGVLDKARAKLKGKKLDLILAQDAQSGRGPFGRTSLRAWILEGNGKATRLGMRTKRQIARLLLDKVEALWYGQRGRTSSS